MEKLDLKISNSATNVHYEKILLRKFFYMIFIDSTGKKIHAYIATVFGGIKKQNIIKNAEDIYKNVQHIQQHPCSLKFKFSSEDEIIKEVKFENLTQSFWDQPECISKVWGEYEIYDDQKEVSELLKKTYPNLYSNNLDAEVDVSKKIYFFNKQGGKDSHKFIATQGIFKYNISEKEYILSGPKDEKNIDGLELMNWVKAEIDLNSSILNTPLFFSITLDENDIYTPDFTWYFAPPHGIIVSEDSYVKIGDKDRDKNSIQRVSDETTVPFKEWVREPEYIDDRKKSRVLFKSTSATNILNLSEDKTIGVSLHLTNPHEFTNRQFWFGLLIAFLLSFCSDKTRINDFYTCLLQTCTCKDDHCTCNLICNAISIGAPLLLLITFITFIFNPKRTFPSRNLIKKRLFTICYISGIISTALFIIYAFGLWLLFPGFWHNHISCSINTHIIIIGFFIALVINAFYIGYCLFRLKRKIYNYI